MSKVDWGLLAAYVAGFAPYAVAEQVERRWGEGAADGAFWLSWTVVFGLVTAAAVRP